MRIGVHVSTSGSIDLAAVRAMEAGANALQIFSSSPRMWRPTTPDPVAVQRFRALREKHDLTPLVVHDSYLINLASVDPVIRQKSIDAFRCEIERAILIGADYLVAHPGNYKDQTLEQGLLAIIEAISTAAKGIRSSTLTILLENTAGAGHQVGGRFEELAVIRKLATERIELAIGYCIDTCHCLVSGWNVASEGGLEDTVESINAVLGLEHVPVIHTNDSKAALGSRLDRHEHIGKGYIGTEGFRRILNHPLLRDKAFILETPVDDDGDEASNIAALKKLCRKSRTITRKSK